MGQFKTAAPDDQLGMLLESMGARPNSIRKRTHDMTKYPHPRTGKLETFTVLPDHGGAGVDWVRFDDGAKAPLRTLKHCKLRGATTHLKEKTRE